MLEEASEEDLMSLRALLAYQFEKEAEKLLEGRVALRRSKTTRRIREVYVEGQLVGTVRANDGMFVPSLRGAARLIELLPYPRLRVVISHDAAEYVAKGRSVFCKHVIEADPEIRPGDEVVVVDERGRLVAVGKATLSGAEMVNKAVGRAVKVRRGIRER